MMVSRRRSRLRGTLSGEHAGKLPGRGDSVAEANSSHTPPLDGPSLQITPGARSAFAPLSPSAHHAVPGSGAIERHSRPQVLPANYPAQRYPDVPALKNCADLTDLRSGHQVYQEDRRIKGGGD